MKAKLPLDPPGMGEQILRLIYPAKCMLCGEILREDARLILCEPCTGLLPWYGKGFEFIPSMPYVNGVLAAFWYENGIESAMYRMKFGKEPRLVETLASLLAQSIGSQEQLPDFDCIVPVPMYKSKRRKRGYNQSELLASLLSQGLEVPHAPGLLVKTRATKPQSLLKREERLTNQADVFKVPYPPLVKDKIILLADDVATTGTTLNACARELYENGAAWVYAAVIAMAPK